MIATKTLVLLLASASLSLGVAACNSADPAGNQAAAVKTSASGLDLAAMDKSIKPGDDFFGYANGSWVKATAIPDDRSSIGGFYKADLAREAATKALFADILKSSPAAGSDEARIKDYYNAYLNTDAIDKAGLTPAKADLDAIAAIGDKAALSRAIGGSLRADTDPLNNTRFGSENLFGVFVTQGLKTPGEQIPYLMQGGLGLPERDYYTNPAKAAERAAYRTFIEAVMKAAGRPDAAAATDRIISLENKIAAAHESREESEDFAKGATLWTRDELIAKAPGIDWPALLDSSGLGGAQRFDAYHVASIPRLAALVGSEPLDSWKDWLAFHTLSQRADVLPKPIRDAAFAFRGIAQQGMKAQRPRDQLALNATSAAIPDAVGKAYVGKVFPAAAKSQVEAMVTSIKAAFAARVKANTTLTEPTRAEALKKLDGMVVAVGYPDAWAPSTLTISATDPYANARAASLAAYRKQIAKIGTPMNRSEWWMPAQLVNAVNLPVQNAINFPAAILQLPFFSASADPAFNYGAIGTVIGHEISHGFDNGGALFDSSGAMRDWWTPADFARFTTSTSMLARQYDGYEVLPGLHVNGKLTLGENIADAAGLQAAYDAYRASLGGKEAPTIDGLTGDQRFFLAFAQSEATKIRDEALKGRLATDVHAPGMTRALTVRNLDGWYTAFNVKPGDKLYLAPDQRVHIW